MFQGPFQLWSLTVPRSGCSVHSPSVQKPDWVPSDGCAGVLRPSFSRFVFGVRRYFAGKDASLRAPSVLRAAPVLGLAPVVWRVFRRGHRAFGNFPLGFLSVCYVLIVLRVFALSGGEAYFENKTSPAHHVLQNIFPGGLPTTPMALFLFGSLG